MKLKSGFSAFYAIHPGNGQQLGSHLIFSAILDKLAANDTKSRHIYENKLTVSAHAMR